MLVECVEQFQKLIIDIDFQFKFGANSVRVNNVWLGIGSNKKCSKKGGPGGPLLREHREAGILGVVIN